MCIFYICFSYNSNTCISHLFTQLQYLDLSYNQLTAEQFSESASVLLPSSLTTLLLHGNPCFSTEAVRDEIMGNLQTQYPNLLNIIITSSESATNEESSNACLDGIEVKEFGLQVKTPFTADGDPLGSLDADAVLREVVDRKCRLQALDLMDISKFVKVSYTTSNVKELIAACRYLRK